MKYNTEPSFPGFQNEIVYILHAPPGQYAELFSTLIIRTLLHQFQDVHGSVKVATGQANANSCLVFVPGQDPYFDPR